MELKMFKNMKLSTKLLIFFLIVGVIPFAVIGTVSLVKSSNTLSNQSFIQIESLREIKRTQIEDFLADMETNTGMLIETINTVRAEAFNKLQSVHQIKKQQVEGYFVTELNYWTMYNKTFDLQVV